MLLKIIQVSKQSHFFFSVQCKLDADLYIDKDNTGDSEKDQYW